MMRRSKIKMRMEFCQGCMKAARERFSVEDYYYWLGKKTAFKEVLEED